MEFKISTDLSLIPKRIEFNAEELKNQLAERLEHYNSLVVTESAIKDAKADRAALNKLKIALETRRKEIKSACSAPYENFKRQYDEVLAMIQKPIDTIDRQIKVFDNKRKDEKLQAITGFWNQNVGECKPYVSFKQVFNPKWLNASFPMGDVHNAIMDIFIKVEDDVKTVKGLNSDFETEALEEYAQTRSVTAAIGKIRRLEERRANEQAKALEVKSATPQTVQTALPPPTDAVSAVPEAVNAPEPMAGMENPDAAETFTVDFRVTATALQLRALKAFLKNNHISFGRVPEKE